MSTKEYIEERHYSVSEDLVPTRERKLAGDTPITFSGRLNPPLVLHEDVTESCGGQLWPAGIALANFLLERRNEWKGKTVLELGAGGGLVGLGLALAWAQESSGKPSSEEPESEAICITDLPQLLPLQQRNIELNSLSENYIKSCCLPWGSPIGSFLPPAHRRPEVILAADCVYYEPAFPLLLETLQALMSSPEDAYDNREAVCWFCMKKRRKADMRFIATLKKTFQVKEIDISGSEEDTSIHLFELRSKPKAEPVIPHKQR